MSDSDQDLPLHLRQTEPLEIEALPLQVSLLTMEVAGLHTRLRLISQLMQRIAEALALPSNPF